jgi:hypothetical protein
MLTVNFPCNLYRLNLTQLLPPLSTMPNQSSSLLQCLQCMALRCIFPNVDEDALLLIDADTRDTTLTALQAGDEPSRMVQFPSLRSTLQLLHQHSGKWPDVSSELNGWKLSTGRYARSISLPDVFETNKADAMMAAVVRAHVLSVRQGVVVWVRSVDGRSSHLPRTCVFTGADCDRLLAIWSHESVAENDDLMAVPSPPQARTETGDVPLLHWCVRRRGREPHGATKRKRYHDDDEKGQQEEEQVQQHLIDPEEDMKVQALPRFRAVDDGIHIFVYKHQHLPFHGLRALWRDAVQQRAETMSRSAVELWRHDVLSCRIAKGYDGEIYVGYVIHVDRDSQSPDSIDHDVLTVQFDDGYLEDFNLSHFYGKGLSCYVSSV